MSIEQSRDFIHDTFEQWIISRDLNIFKEYNVIQALNECLDYCIRNGDNSPAFYDDSDTEDEIDYQMVYISDRWFCSGRIRFLMRVIGDQCDE